MQFTFTIRSGYTLTIMPSGQDGYELEDGDAIGFDFDYDRSASTSAGVYDVANKEYITRADREVRNDILFNYRATEDIVVKIWLTNHSANTLTINGTISVVRK